MNRRRCFAVVLAACSSWAHALPTPTEQQRIDRLIDAVAQQKDIRFLRNGREYSATQAADFLRGKLKWRIEKVHTVQDFIDEVGTRSTTSGEAYLVRQADGRTLPSADFLRQELRRVDKTR